MAKTWKHKSYKYIASTDLTSSESRSILDVGRLSEGTVRAADIMVVTADDDWSAQPAVGHGLVERDSQPAGFIFGRLTIDLSFNNVRRRPR